MQDQLHPVGGAAPPQSLHDGRAGVCCTARVGAGV
jgi:hypothetical protein